MKEAIAKLGYLRIAPRKVRLLADMIKGKSVKEAGVQLNFSAKKAALPMLKLLKSAVANAKNNLKMPSDDLIIRRIKVDGGPVLKRYMPKARGRATVIRRKTSHITVVLSDKKS